MPLTALIPDQLIRFTQVVCTALSKSCLLTMPGLLGSLCRIESWYEVSEVKAFLREREVRWIPLRRDGNVPDTLLFTFEEILRVDIPV